MSGRAKLGSCRIIGGRWRSRVVLFDDADGLRPTTDRIRETVFNWLQPYLHQSNCLDAFAGSGILGLEALSRGAGSVVFIEKNIKTANSLNSNIKLLDAAGASVYQQDTISWLQSAASNKDFSQCFDLAFLDPPFRSDLLVNSSVLLENSGCLADDAIIYVEHAVDSEVSLPEHWFCLKQKKSGQVAYKLFERRG